MQPQLCFKAHPSTRHACTSSMVLKQHYRLATLASTRASPSPPGNYLTHATTGPFLTAVPEPK